jgi:protein required for attachment to host cells
MHLKPTLIVIADASGAQFFKTEDRGATIEPATTRLGAPANPASHEIKSDRPGRTHQSVGTARSAITPKTDPHQKAEDAFTRVLARHLDELAGNATYRDILIFAPPVLLGVLRKDLSRAVAAKIVGEVHKDLAKSSHEEIRAHVRQALFPV